jgi:hypothetical protein
VAIQGAGYTIELENVIYRPVGATVLADSIPKTDMHGVALTKIGAKLGTDGERTQLKGAKSMVELRETLLRCWTRETSTSEALDWAKHLNFGETPWAINVESLTRALQAIAIPTLPIEGFPIHHSMIFEMDRASVVWSSFGGMAPSFRIPNTRPMSLEGPMMIPQKKKDGSAAADINVTKVSCRNVLLKVAIRDLHDTIEKKEILNPFTQPNVRASTMNQNRFFSGPDCRRIVQCLREACGITAVDLARNKRKASDDVDEPGRKRGAFDVGF